MKKWIMLGITLIAMLVAVAAFALPVSAGMYGDLTYTVSNGKVTITDCDTSVSGMMTIPGIIEGCPVTTIGHGAFRGCSELTGVDIPGSVTRIDVLAFRDCTKLMNINIPDSVKIIGSSVFVNTAYYNDDSNWENGVLYIDKHLIKAQNSNSDSYAIKSGTLTIAMRAFESASGYKQITIPDSVTVIGPNAFQSARIETVIIRSGVTEIGASAFEECSSLTSVDIPDSVTTIGVGAFADCTRLTSIEIPDSVTTLGQRAFEGCTRLSSVKLSNNTTIIEQETFKECKALTNIVIPCGVTEIRESAFSQCDGGLIVTIPASVKRIYTYAFQGCIELQITIYSSTVEIDKPLSINPTATIYGYDNSTAQAYANGFGMDFVSLGERHPCTFNQTNTSPTYLRSAATCTSPAKYYYSCACGEKGTSTFTIGSALGHTYENACDTACDICGVTRSASHTYTNACDTSCNTCGYTRTITHSYSTKWSTNGSNHWHECTVCGAKKDESAHKPGAAATETTAQTCTVCGYVIKAALGHTHQYDTDWSKDATSHWHECDCGAKKDSASHNWDDGKVTTEPTTSAEGERTFTCTVCKATRTEAIDQLPPVTTTVPVTTEPTPETDAPVTTEPPTTEAPTIETAPATTAATRPMPNASDMDTHRGDKTASDSDDGSTLIITVLAVCLGAAVIALAVALMKKKK